MSNPPAPTPEAAADTTLIDSFIRTIFAPRTPVWLTEEKYEEQDPSWRITLVCPGQQSGWMSRRYKIDIPSATLNFIGTQPISDAELNAARNAGRRVRI
ncbi:MAG: hypothetical protein HC822_01780 [Oscillochloris sp.]|nr:hypothetical protein [Oscillochloris sp.]